MEIAFPGVAGAGRANQPGPPIDCSLARAAAPRIKATPIVSIRLC
jgi:hypothetical protein